MDKERLHSGGHGDTAVTKGDATCNSWKWHLFFNKEKIPDLEEFTRSVEYVFKKDNKNTSKQGRMGHKKKGNGKPIFLCRISFLRWVDFCHGLLVFRMWIHAT